MFVSSFFNFFLKLFCFGQFLSHCYGTSSTNCTKSDTVCFSFYLVYNAFRNSFILEGPFLKN